MPSLSLAEALRYFMSGLVFFYFVYIYDSELTIKFQKSFGALGLTLCLLVLGTMIYLIYRALVYDTAIIWIHDITRIKTDNYRTYFKKKYNISSSQALQLYKQIRLKHLNEKYNASKMEASGIHLLYIISILSIPFIILNIISKESNTLIFFIIVFAIFFFAAFIWDRKFENMELGFIKEIKTLEIDETAQKVFGDRNI